MASLGRALLEVLDADGRDMEDPVEYLRERLREHGAFQDQLTELDQQLDVAHAQTRSLERELGLLEHGHGHDVPVGSGQRVELVQPVEFAVELTVELVQPHVTH